ncbi:MAG: tRNA (guanosine(46)-N7)-methyltransferase TrmB [Oscillospiraceae bacterium]|nr:tRNA (guanosine(46)-N7)-methyltransferase TrmB [Ruminococcus sp.]MDD7337804.1 tRNA (guanosine(46)-N7)-methyltransferase TrmB [Ruminococcus sp.]MDY6062108.1 tRNA (guanosine(46)-N7)-methyltransferase TrmB [Oscillospiraceae bacterium]
MRMRRKRNLDQRLADCKDKLFEIITDELNFEKAIQNKEYIDFDKIFGNDNPTVLEIGCGKGKFACEYAKAHPEQNVIAVEKYGNVIVEACERAIEDGIDNLYFIKGNAEYLPKYIKDGSVERIFLNFSCPFPKNKYAIHRLTHHRFLSIYRLLLCEGGEIHQKTDNMHFFEFSIEEFSQNGFALKNVSLDLHRSGFEDNIMTEYEARFSSMGMPIYRLEAYIK